MALRCASTAGLCGRISERRTASSIRHPRVACAEGPTWHGPGTRTRAARDFRRFSPGRPACRHSTCPRCMPGRASSGQSVAATVGAGAGGGVTWRCQRRLVSRSKTFQYLLPRGRWHLARASSISRPIKSQCVPAISLGSGAVSTIPTNTGHPFSFLGRSSRRAADCLPQDARARFRRNWCRTDGSSRPTPPVRSLSVLGFTAPDPIA